MRILIRISNFFWKDNILNSDTIVLVSTVPVKMIKSSSNSSILLYNWKNSHHIFNTKPFQRHGDFFSRFLQNILKIYNSKNVNIFQCFVSITFNVAFTFAFTQSPLRSISVIPNNFCKYLAKLS